MSGLVFIGDSVTLGVRPGVLETDTFVHKIAASRDAAYINAGIGGNNSGQMVTRFATDVLANFPDWVGIMSGINDVDAGVSIPAYKANLGWMIDQARAASAKPVLFTPTPTNDVTILPGLPAYVHACREVAAEKAAPIVDTFAAFCEIAVVPGGATYTGLFQDLQHPGPSGHTVVSDQLQLPRNASLFTANNQEGGPMYQSSEQLITPGGALNLVHGLGATPSRVDLFLKCVDPELESVVGDMVPVPPGAIYDGNSRGCTVRLTSTEIKVRFGNATWVFVMHSSTGAASSLTNAKWKLVVRAYP